MIDKEKELQIINRAKVAYCMSHGHDYIRMEKIFIDNKEQYCFVFEKSEELKDLIEEFNNNEELRLYNSCFKFIAYEVHRAKIEL